MFLPLHDDTPLKVIRFQFVTVLIMAINVGVFLATGAFQGEANLASVTSSFGFVPAEFLGAANQGPVASGGPLHEALTLITFQFIHAGWLHLIGNMLFLWVFADNIEDVYGYGGFALFYLLCGVAGGLVHAVMMPHSPSPLIGASGSVSGVLAAYMVLFPKARVWILLFLRIPVPLPAFWVLGGWFLIQVFSLFASLPGQDIAWYAHIGGFSTGLVITLVLRSWLAPPTRRRI